MVTSWQEDNLDNTDPKVSEDNLSKCYSNHNSFKNDYKKHIIFETKWNLGLHAWRSNYKGRNARSKVESLTQSLNMQNQLISEYRQQFIELQLCAPWIPNEVINKMGIRPKIFNETKRRKVLVNALSGGQKNELLSSAWKPARNEWKNTLNHLSTLKPIVQQRENEQKLLSNLLKEQSESNGNGGR